MEKPILIFDNQSNSLIPLDTGQHTFTMYVCGPTVYDSSHLGHARNYIVFDTMRRVLEDYFNKNVIFIMNITDIDDKIIKKANELYNDVSLEKCKLVSSKYENSFFDDMDKLNVKRPTIITRVTEYIKEMVLYIKQIMENGYAYRTDNGSINFNSKKYIESGLNSNPFKLNQVSISFQNMLNSVTDELSSETDFCLWKAKKDNEPYYQTEIGDGRPGWHIECSAMASSITKNIDIHGGGIDLRFPHHHNEILQANAYSCTINEQDGTSVNENKWVKIFTHCGHLSISGHKMAKRLKNFITIDEFIKKYQPQLIRLYFLMYPYQHELELSELEIMKLDTLNTKLKVFFNLNKLLDTYENTQIYSTNEKNLIEQLQKKSETVDISLRNNMDIGTSILNLEKLIDLTNSYMSECHETNNVNKNVVMQIYNYVTKMIKIFGLIQNNTENQNNKESIGVILQLRNSLRTLIIEEKDLTKGAKKKLYEITDEIRDKILPSLGVNITDIK